MYNYKKVCKTEQGFDIVKLIEENPVKNFNKEYQNKFIHKIKDNFNNDEQGLFLASFYSYLNYDQAKEFIIDLNNIWKWLGFSRKDFCKVVLERHFEKDTDYIIKTKEKAAPFLTEAKNNEEKRGGHNKEVRINDIFKDDLQKYICKLTPSTKTSTTREKREFVIFTKIIFKYIN